jgi:hypothetical protein
MKCLWEQERMKLDLIGKDEEKIKSKLEDMYRKNKVSWFAMMTINFPYFLLIEKSHHNKSSYHNKHMLFANFKSN